MNYFKNKVAVVTGAGSGMGRALAKILVSRGCSVAICDINEKQLQETTAQLQNAPVMVTSHVIDVAEVSQLEMLAEQVSKEHGKINLLFNNAGVSVTNTAEKMPPEDFEWLMNINFWGVVHGCRVFLPYLRQVEAAHIINTSSIFGIIALPTQSAYNASKFAVRGFTESLRQELQGTPISVSCVHPGGVKTNIVRDSRYTPADNESSSKEEFIERFNSMAGLTADEAATIILRGVARKKPRIFVGHDAILISILERLFPVYYSTILRRWLNWGGS